MMQQQATIGLALLALSGAVAACAGEVDETINPSFDEWCGQALCNWEVNSGTVSRAPTWNEDDHGVSLDGNPCVVSQITSGAGAVCVEVEILASLEKSVHLHFQVDRGDDGSLEYDEPLVLRHWETFRFKLRTDNWGENTRIALRKKGDGQAVIALLRLNDTYDCAGAELVRALPDAAGARQVSDAAREVAGPN